MIPSHNEQNTPQLSFSQSYGNQSTPESILNIFQPSVSASLSTPNPPQPCTPYPLSSNYILPYSNDQQLTVQPSCIHRHRITNPAIHDLRGASLGLSVEAVKDHSTQSHHTSHKVPTHSKREYSFIPYTLNRPKERTGSNDRKTQAAHDLYVRRSGLYIPSHSFNHRFVMRDKLNIGYSMAGNKICHGNEPESENIPDSNSRCRWGNSPCNIIISNTNITGHLQNGHNVQFKTSSKSQIKCRWKDCKHLVNEASLVRHIRCHLNEKFECDTCGKLYSRTDSLKRHRRNHCKANRGAVERNLP
jgi:hypothetical protein